ncbi:MAG: HAD family phosphatase [Oscillospiraceae bacterium]|nr:HAD family phosphatase [Oscillospiraceae bacterium]
MYKLAAFDLDNTLAEVGKGIPDGDLRLLRELEKTGVRIAVCSGKSADYLCGFMRQAGLEAPILIGENGSVIQFGVDLPPAGFYVLPYSREAKAGIERLRAEIECRLPGIWFQADTVGITPFPVTDEEFETVARCIGETDFADVDVYRHPDSFDIVPKGMNKGRGLEYLCGLLGIGLSEAAAVGDGVNDYPMFDAAGLAVGIGVKDRYPVDLDFDTVGGAIRFLMKN